MYMCNKKYSGNLALTATITVEWKVYRLFCLTQGVVGTNRLLRLFTHFWRKHIIRWHIWNTTEPSLDHSLKNLILFVFRLVVIFQRFFLFFFSFLFGGGGSSNILVTTTIFYICFFSFSVSVNMFIIVWYATEQILFKWIKLFPFTNTRPLTQNLFSLHAYYYNDGIGT